VNIEVGLGKTVAAGPYSVKLVDLLPYPAEIMIPEKTAILLVKQIWK